MVQRVAFSGMVQTDTGLDSKPREESCGGGDRSAHILYKIIIIITAL